MTGKAGLAGILVIALMAGGARAEAPAVFDLSIRGLRAGTVSFTGTEDGGRYSVAGRLESGGLVGMLRSVRYDATVQGAVRGARYVPGRYAEKADTGKRKSEAVMEYRRGVPQVKVYDPPRAAGEAGLDPSTQGGTVDPLTALYAVMKDVAPGKECNLKLAMFDGRRRSQLALGVPAPAGEGVACAGEYRRLEGFSAEDMAEKTRFPFTVTLLPGADGAMRVAEVRMETLFGNAVMTRR